MAGPDNKCRVPLLFAFKALLRQKNMLLSDRMLAFLAQFFLKKISRKFCGIEKRHYLCNRNQQNVDSVAQLVEQMTLNHWVESSSLSGVTKQSLKSGCFFISAGLRLWRTSSTHPHVPGYGRVLSLRDDGHTDVERFCQCQSNDEGNRRRAVV